jgi:hypothetical protein
MSESTEAAVRSRLRSAKQLSQLDQEGPSDHTAIEVRLEHALVMVVALERVVLDLAKEIDHLRDSRSTI